MWAGPNAMIFIILSRLPNEMSRLYFGQLKGGIFFFFYCALFVFTFDQFDEGGSLWWADRRTEGKTDLVHAFAP